MKVSDYLSFLAEVLLEHAITVAKAELVARHGEPGGPDTGFAVIGYGKLGGIELSYGSDLDLVFVYQGGDGCTTGPKPIDNIRFYTRLAQRVVHVLSTRMATGRLYEVDLRLRPHGESGLVAVSLQGFRQYQLESAWIWEHQALVRTRAVVGDASLVHALTALRQEILTQSREIDNLAAEVSAMRRRMLQEGSGRLATESGWFDLKRDPGGIVDIEFVVQYLVLAHAHRFPALTRWSDNIRILDSLKETGVLPEEQANALVSAYLAYRSAVHVAALEGVAAVGESVVFMPHLERVKAIRDHWLPNAGLDEAS
jgi:glutamate-ammonia-ligase adenylyltransferase